MPRGIPKKLVIAILEAAGLLDLQVYLERHPSEMFGAYLRRQVKDVDCSSFGVIGCGKQSLDIERKAPPANFPSAYILRS
jgi:hypothetical protein